MHTGKEIGSPGTGPRPNVCQLLLVYHVYGFYISSINRLHSQWRSQGAETLRQLAQSHATKYKTARFSLDFASEEPVRNLFIFEPSSLPTGHSVLSLCHSDSLGFSCNKI